MATPSSTRRIRRRAIASLLVPAAMVFAATAAAQEWPGVAPSPQVAEFPSYVPVQEVSNSHLLAPPPVPAEPKNALRPLAEVVIDTRLPGTGALPTDAAVQAHPPAATNPQWIDVRPWMTYEFAWHAAGLAHRPNYFEDLNLERYGNSACPVLQPGISAARFAAATVMLPYNMTVHRPRECIYMLGYCRPGSPAPNLGYVPPLRLDAAAVEAAAITGAVFIVP